MVFIWFVFTIDNLNDNKNSVKHSVLGQLGREYDANCILIVHQIDLKVFCVILFVIVVVINVVVCDSIIHLNWNIYNHLFLELPLLAWMALHSVALV